MRKQMIAIITSVMLLLCSVMTCASAENTLPDLVDTVSTLLFNTSNVTIRAEADFELNDQPFKHFNGTHIQVGKDICRDILLTTPQYEGSEKESGYIIVVDGSQKVVYNRYLHQARFYDGITHRDSVLRPSAEANNLVDMCRIVAAFASSVLPQNAIERKDNTLIITLDAENDLTPVNAALTMIMQRFGAYRNYVDYRQITVAPEAADIWDYSTITEGILYCTTDIHIEHLGLTISMDNANRLTGMEGSCKMTLVTRNGSGQDLTVSFRADITDYGTSILPENPIPADELLAGQKDKVKMSLTEIYGYSQEDADAFVMNFDGMNIICYPAGHPDWEYQWNNWLLYTPFATDYEYYPGEGVVRGFLTMAREYNWLNDPSARNRTIMQTWFSNCDITMNEELSTYMDNGGYTAEQFIYAYFRSCYGPDENWPVHLKEWLNEEITYWNNDTSSSTDAANTPDSLVYYNPNGGSMYHADMNCRSIHTKYLPLVGSCSLEKLASAELNYLKPCSVCNAPVIER